MLDSYYLPEDLREGMELEVLLRDTSDANVWGNQFLPVRVEKEYPFGFRCTVLPHVNGKGMGVSSEYTITINKNNCTRDYLLRPIQ